ncbi:MAG: glycerol-3-phosphate ABC transporter ATP-binding protein [Spirochaetes bacterium RBG_16_67_19]|nr:MAG: glycerol-3-phosphate ABC transporter ATP-binding protein [Spirochaetes bacterium GWB1_66_5]OHD74012.1 MAG: glycerol-3-phosphate ABC transporter ATP-binding protein [Spirochaetes bacterium RBG_16_67_19]
MANVELKNVRKVYEGGVLAVDNCSITINDKEFVVLVGPSGCGKSTTLRMVAGLEEITSGELFIDGKLMNDVAPKDRDIAMVFQNYALYPHMTVYENMAFGLKIRKFPKKEINERVHEAAGILDIEELLDRKPKALSGGQRQRVAVGRAIVRKPKVFLFDEPLSNLDAKLRVQMRAEISALHHRLQATMIYVTHDQTEAMTMGDRIVVLKDGLIQQIGTPLGLYNKPINRFVAGFIGSPQMNIMKSTIKEAGGRLVADEGDFTVALEGNVANTMRPYLGKDVLIGIRPEDMVVTDKAMQGQTLTARVEVVEPLGAEILLYVSTKQHESIIVRIPPHHVFKVGDSATLKPALEKIHFFDLETESAVI